MNTQGFVNENRNEFETDDVLCSIEIIEINSSSDSMSLDDENLSSVEKIVDDSKENHGPYKYSSHQYEKLDKFKATSDLLLLINGTEIPKKVSALHMTESLNSTARNTKVVSTNQQELFESEADSSSMNESIEDSFMEYVNTAPLIYHETLTDEEIIEITKILEEHQENSD